MSKKLSQDSELQTLTLSPSSPNSPPLPPAGHHTEQFGPHCFNNPSSSHEVGQKERSAGNAKTKNEKCEKGLSHNAKAKQVDDDGTAAQTGRVSSGGQAGKVSSGGQAGRVSSGGQAGKVSSGGLAGRASSAGQAGRVSSGGQAGRVSSGGSGHTTSTRSASKDANSSSAATNVTVMLQQAPPPSQMAAHHSKQHQSLVQSSSMQNTPKQKTERVFSAPGSAAAVIISSKAYNKPMDTGAALDSNVGPLFHPHHPTQQQHPTRLVPHHPPLAATTRNRAPQPNLTANASTTHGGGGGVRSDGTPASGRSAGSPLPLPPSSTRGSATSSPFRQYASSTSFPAPPQRSPPQAERIELGHFRNLPAQVSTPGASHTTATDLSPYVRPTVATTITSQSVALPPHLVTRLKPTIPVSGLAINCIATPTSFVNTLSQSSSQSQQNTTSRPFSTVVPGKTLATHDLVSMQSASAVPVSRAPQPAPGRSSHPIKLESLQGNITLHIKPEVIHSTNTRPAHTALLIEPDSGPGFIPGPRLSPGKRVAMPQSSPSRGETLYASMAVPGAPMPSEPLCPSTETTTCGNIDGGNEKPTSLLTQLLSQSTKGGSSSQSASDILKFWSDSRAPKKPNFGSNVALAGSNGSNSDSNSSELSESSNAGKSLLQSDCFCKNSSTAGFTSGLASESSSTQAFGSSSSLNPSASAGNFSLPTRKETRNNFVSEKSRGLLMSEPLREPRYHKDWFATELSRFTEEDLLDVMGSAKAPLNPNSLLDDDDDEAWFDSVTKLNEKWFRPGMNSATSSIAMTATPVGKSDVARMSGFGGLGRNRGGATLGGGSSSLIGRSSTATDLHQKMGSISRLESSSSYAGLATPLTGLPTRGLSTTTPQSALTRSTKPTRSTLDLTNLNCDKSGASNSSTNATFGSNAALANTSTSNLTAWSGNLNLVSNRSNVAALRKVLHQRGLYQRRLHTKTHANLIKTNIDDAGAVKEIEAGLLHLMEEFQAGNLAAFGKDSRLRQMEAIREQQESLARLHQEVGVRQDLYQPLSAEGLQSNSEHMSTLMGKLECLSEAIENLHSNASCDRKTSTSDATVIPSTAGGTSSSHTVDDKRGTTSNTKEDTVDDAGVELRKKSNNRGTLHKTSSLGGAGGGGRDNGLADVAATDGNGAFLDRSRISKGGGGASFVRSSSQKHMEYSRVPAVAVVTVTRGNSFTNGVVDPVGRGFDMNNRSRSKSKGKRNTENEDRSAIEGDGKTKQAGKNDEHQRHRHRKHTKEKDVLQKSGEPRVVDGNCFTVPSLNAGADFREGTEMKQFGHRKVPYERKPPVSGLQQHQFIIGDGRAPEPSNRVDANSFPSDSSHPAPVVEHRHHHHSDRHSRIVAKKTAPSHFHQPERTPIDLQRPSPSLQRQPPSVPARPSRTAPPLAPGAGHPPIPAVEGESPSKSGRPVKPNSSRFTPLPVLP